MRELDLNLETNKPDDIFRKILKTKRLNWRCHKVYLEKLGFKSQSKLYLKYNPQTNIFIPIEIIFDRNEELKNSPKEQNSIKENLIYKNSMPLLKYIEVDLSEDKNGYERFIKERGEYENLRKANFHATFAKFYLRKQERIQNSETGCLEFFRSENKGNLTLTETTSGSFSDKELDTIEKWFNSLKE